MPRGNIKGWWVIFANIYTEGLFFFSMTAFAI